VLDGATALGLVSRHGQSLSVDTNSTAKPGTLRWTALDMDGKPWMEAGLVLENGRWSLAPDSAEIPENQRLMQGLQAAWDLASEKQFAESSPTTSSKQSPAHSLAQTGLRVTTSLEFPRRWGLGSSSTLIALLAEWWGIDARQLYSMVQNGSGYDLEIALGGRSMLYNREPLQIQPLDFRIPPGSLLRLVDPGSKQISSAEVSRYRNLSLQARAEAVPRISQISEALAKGPTIQEMLELLQDHDLILEGVLGQPSLHTLEGHGFPGRLKSLGAWGGDLFLAASDQPSLAMEWLDNHLDWTSYPLEDLIQISQN
jgi:hypothetical protein